MSGTRVLLGLARACHAGPTFVVTVAVAAIAASLGRTWLGVVLVALAVLLGQLSVGWSNDAHDARVDTQTDRTEKPIVAGLVNAQTVKVSSYAALALCIPMSYLAAGPIGGSAHVIAVASAWIYNFWLKTSVLSLLPYVVSFALVAPFLTYGLDPEQQPAWWFIITLALLGLAAGMANGIPDIESDKSVNTGGLVARLGARTSGLIAALGVFVATGLLATHTGLSNIVAVLLMAAASAAAIVAAIVENGRYLFTVVLVLALTDAVLLCFAGADSLVK